MNELQELHGLLLFISGAVLNVLAFLILRQKHLTVVQGLLLFWLSCGLFVIMGVTWHHLGELHSIIISIVYYCAFVYLAYKLIQKNNDKQF